MGNAIRCPAGFVRMQVQGCYVKCPKDLGFVDFKKNGGPQSCAFQNEDGKIDETTAVVLEQTPFLPAPPQSEQTTAPISPTLDQVKETNPDAYAVYDAENKRVKEAIKIILDKIGRKKAADLAFLKLQDAENSRDSAPEAYIAARNAYYTLAKGETWLSEEQKRVEAAEITPVLRKVINEYSDARDRLRKTSKLNEALIEFKQRMGGIQDEFVGSVQLLGKQLNNVQKQLNLERRETEQKKPVILPFVTYILNGLIILASIFAIVNVIKALTSKGNPYATPMGVYNT